MLGLTYQDGLHVVELRVTALIIFETSVGIQMTGHQSASCCLVYS
jgi:hypothetical protein